MTNSEAPAGVTPAAPDLRLAQPDFWVRPDRRELYRRLRDEAPVSWQPEDPCMWNPNGGRGYWAVTRHADVVTVTRNPKVYSSADGAGYLDEPREEIEGLSILTMDDPDHKRLRNVVAQGFTPKFVQSLIPKATAAAQRVLDMLDDSRDKADVVALVSHQYPVNLICDILGLPVADRPRFVELTNIAFGPDRPASYAAHQELIAYGRNLGKDRRERPSDDLISVMVTAEIEGKPLTDDEVGFFVSLLIGAGAETTGSTIASAMWALHTNRDQLTAWRNDLDGVTPAAVEELIRWASPVISFRRTATVDTELNGQAIRKGDKVVMYYEAANQDERVFQSPDKLVLTRKPNPHVSFGIGGPHHCIGAPLAQMELRTFFRMFFDRFKDFEAIEPPHRIPSGMFNMTAMMPIRLSH